MLDGDQAHGRCPLTCTDVVLGTYNVERAGRPVEKDVVLDEERDAWR
ncbi:hypothetical protein KALB_5380 [Kutzneria albida DSM 43870]|uniref:Uncharacterized protein n=1 Tax=Kutzneria albida DSM 43870 TaxID=1449976 RepID=W5WD15_9PSEU|nr:hypothetical protein KALB_5380 [Kutzneria albida DSM 43870]